MQKTVFQLAIKTRLEFQPSSLDMHARPMGELKQTTFLSTRTLDCREGTGL